MCITMRLELSSWLEPYKPTVGIHDMKIHDLTPQTLFSIEFYRDLFEWSSKNSMLWKHRNLVLLSDRTSDEDSVIWMTGHNALLQENRQVLFVSIAVVRLRKFETLVPGSRPYFVVPGLTNHHEARPHQMMRPASYRRGWPFLTLVLVRHQNIRNHLATGI